MHCRRCRDALAACLVCPIAVAARQAAARADARLPLHAPVPALSGAPTQPLGFHPL